MSAKRKQVTLAVVGSVGIHLFVLFAWALAVQWFPAAQAANKEPRDGIKLQVVEEKPATPPPEPEAIPTPSPSKPVVFKDTPDLPDASPTPKDATFQSDRNSEAATELPGTGDKPLPMQTGKKIPVFAFDPRSPASGEAGNTAGQTIPENMPPPVLATAPPPPRPVSTPLPQPTATPAATVPVDPRDLAMVTPRSIPANPADAEPNPYDPSIRPPSNMTEPPRPTPVPRRGGYRPMQERTESAGGAGKTGPNSVASEATPTGRYEAFVIRSIDRRWHQFFDARADLVTLGTVRVHFAVDRGGKIRSSRVVSNTANEALASIALQAVAEAQIPPMPDEVVATSSGGQLPIEIFFNAEAPAF